MTVVVLMHCPECTYEREFPEGQSYSQVDLVCPNDGTDMVVRATFEREGPPPELTPQEPAPVEPAVTLSADDRLRQILALEEECQRLERRYDGLKDALAAAKKGLAEKNAALREYIQNSGKVPAALPLFDTLPPPSADEELRARLSELNVEVTEGETDDEEVIAEADA